MTLYEFLKKKIHPINILKKPTEEDLCSEKFESRPGGFIKTRHEC